MRSVERYRDHLKIHGYTHHSVLVGVPYDRGQEYGLDEHAHHHLITTLGYVLFYYDVLHKQMHLTRRDSEKNHHHELIY